MQCTLLQLFFYYCCLIVIRYLSVGLTQMLVKIILSKPSPGCEDCSWETVRVRAVWSEVWIISHALLLSSSSPRNFFCLVKLPLSPWWNPIHYGLVLVVAVTQWWIVFTFFYGNREADYSVCTTGIQNSNSDISDDITMSSAKLWFGRA